MRARQLATTAVLAVVATLLAVPAAHAVVPPLTLGAVSTLIANPGSTASFGNLNVTEDAAGRLQVNDTLTFKFQDSGSASTIHFGTVGSVGGTNGLAGKAKISSSGGTLLDQMVVTVTSASTGAFPGVLTLAGLNPALDANASLGLVKVTVNHVGSGGNHLVNAAAPSDANVVSGTAPKAVYKEQSSPPVEQTGTTQQIGNVVITEPAKSFFKTGDVITFTLRDAQGSTDTIGLASTPVAIGGSMQVSVKGASTTAVQTNDTSFKVVVDAEDPSNGSTSAISVTNLYVNTARAPLGPVTLTAVLTTGAATEYIVPGRVVVAGVGGVTSTTSNGTPTVALSGTGLPAGNVSIAAASGSMANGEQITLTIQEPGVTFSTGAKAPLATVTSGDLVLQSAQAALTADANAVANKVATFTIKTGNSKAANVVIGPIFYDVAGGTAGNVVTLAAAGSPGSAFVPQSVDNAVLAPVHPVVRFTTSPAALTPLSGAPWTGADVTITPASAGSVTAGSTLYLLSPFASQIAAYRTTYAQLPSVSGTGIGAPTLNSSALVVQTASGAVTAPAQTVLSIPVTGTPGTITVTGIVYSFGAYVPPGHLVGTGSVVASGGSTAADGEQYVSLSNAKGLGSVSSTSSVPTVYFTQTPPSATTSTEATFLFYSDPTGANFSCVLDGVAIGPCNSGWTYTGFSSGTHTFTVVPSTETATGQPATYTWSVDSTAPTATAPTAMLGTALTVTFSEAVLGAGTMTWLDAVTNAPVAGALSCKNGTTAVPCNGAGGITTASLVPTAPLVPGAGYKVLLSYAPNIITDLAGTPLPQTTLTTRASLVAEETALAATSLWRRVATTSASGGSYAMSHLAGATTSFTFTGTNVAWYTVKGPTFGTATVYLDGVAKATFNGYSSAYAYGVKGYGVAGLANTKHTLTVKVNGVKGSSVGKDTMVAVDRFLVGTTTTQQDGAGTRQQWRRVTTSSALGGAYAVEDQVGASWAMPFRGTGISWYGVAGPTMGKAQVYVDGVLRATVDLYATSVVYKKRLFTLAVPSGAHTIKIVSVASTRGKLVTVDRLAVV